LWITIIHGSAWIIPFKAEAFGLWVPDAREQVISWLSFALRSGLERNLKYSSTNAFLYVPNGFEGSWVITNDFFRLA